MHKLYKHLDGVLGGVEGGQEQRVLGVGLCEDLAPRGKREGRKEEGKKNSQIGILR